MSNWDKPPVVQPSAQTSMAVPLPPPAVADALASDKERLRKAALKNLEYMRKKEMKELEQRLAQPADGAKVSSQGAVSSAHRSKRARVSRAGIGCGSVQNTSVYITQLPTTNESSTAILGGQKKL